MVLPYSVMCANHMLLVVLVCLCTLGSVVSHDTQVPIDTKATSKTYNGIGGLSNSCMPWIRSFPQKQLDDILDVLFKPNYAAALQILKIEIGGDGHSTINTEACYRHSPDEDPDFTRGWELWFASEAKKRNPDIIIFGLPWSFPYWFSGLGDASGVKYYVDWVQGAKLQWNITVDYLGIKNEAGVPAPDDVINLRHGLDAAGLQHVQIVTPDTHEFSIAPQLSDPTSAIYQAIGVLGFHEPLRSTQDLPAWLHAVDKPIWSSEAYTTYSDTNGGGCWARALNWGFVYGNVSAHIAWNILQAYPSVGSGMDYNGHGLMWAESPWDGHYTINSPIWVSAHYTQFTKPGWKYLQVGQGSGELAGGGTYVTLVDTSTNTNVTHFTLVLQTMEYNMSQCFKDTHAPFTVAPTQTVTFQLRNAGLVPNTTLRVRRTVLVAGDPIDPILPYNATSTFFEQEPDIHVDASGVFTVTIQANSIVTITSLGNSSGGKVVPTIPHSSPFPARYTDNLTAYPVGQGARFCNDQQGVFESAVSRDGSGSRTLQQSVPHEPLEWHSWRKLKFPHTFVGPAITSANLSCSVLPSTAPGGFAGIGVGPQGTQPAYAASNPYVLAINSSGHWYFAEHSGAVPVKLATDPTWFPLRLEVTAAGLANAYVGGDRVAQSQYHAPPGMQRSNDAYFCQLVASYSMGISRSEFKELTLELTQFPTTPAPSPVPPPPAPGPPPPPVPVGSGLQLVPCNATDLRQLWTFTGEDGGEAGRFSTAAAPLDCVDALKSQQPARTSHCNASNTGQVWQFSSKEASITSVATAPCEAPPLGSNIADHTVSKIVDRLFSSAKQCHMCFDAQPTKAHMGLFDCKANDNQKWLFDPSQGSSQIRSVHLGQCVGSF